MTQIPRRLDPHAYNISKIFEWLADGCDQDEFDRHAAAESFHDAPMTFHHGDTPILGVFNPGQAWLELLHVLQHENLVKARKRSGKMYYEIA